MISGLTMLSPLGMASTAFRPKYGMSGDREKLMTRIG
jgi:hypothetical protein